MLLPWMFCFDLMGRPLRFFNGWYVNNLSAYSASFLHVLPCQSELYGEGKGRWERGGKERQKPFIIDPLVRVLQSRARLGSMPRLIPAKRPPVTRWLQSLAPGRQSAQRKPSIQWDEGNTTTSCPRLIIKSPQPQMVKHLHLNVRLPS